MQWMLCGKICKNRRSGEVDEVDEVGEVGEVESKVKLTKLEKTVEEHGVMLTTLMKNK